MKRRKKKRRKRKKKRFHWVLHFAPSMKNPIKVLKVIKHSRELFSRVTHTNPLLTTWPGPSGPACIWMSCEHAHYSGPFQQYSSILWVCSMRLESAMTSECSDAPAQDQRQSQSVTDKRISSVHRFSSEVVLLGLCEIKYPLLINMNEFFTEK